MRAATAAVAGGASVFEKDRVLVASDGASIAYASYPEGDRVPVLYVNGWSCPDAYWEGVLPGLLERGHPAVVADVRGSGRSRLPRPPGFAGRNVRPGDVSVERLARDVLEVLDDAGVGRAVLVGHSMGVQILFEALRLAPARVAALVPIAGAFENPVRTFADLAVLDRLYSWADPVFQRFPWTWLRPVTRPFLTPEIAWRVARAVGLGGDKVAPDHLAAHVVQIRELDFSVLWRIMAQMRQHSAADLLPEITVPVLVLAGRRDYMTPPSVQRRMFERIPGSELVWFEQGTHLLPVDEAPAIVEIVSRFLERRVGPGLSAKRRNA